VNLTLLKKLEQENLKRDHSKLSPEEQQFFKLHQQEKISNLKLLDEMREQGDVSPEMLSLLEDTLKASALEEIIGNSEMDETKIIDE